MIHQLDQQLTGQGIDILILFESDQRRVFLVNAAVDIDPVDLL